MFSYKFDNTQVEKELRKIMGRASPNIEKYVSIVILTNNCKNCTIPFYNFEMYFFHVSCFWVRYVIKRIEDGYFLS